MATSFEAPTTPLGFDELTIAGGLRGRPVELVDCVTQPTKSIARAELVLEGEFRLNDRVDEDAMTGLGWAMPEFPGYVGQAQKDLAVFTVTGITHRVDPILQILIGPGEEHVTLTGLPTETSIYRLLDDAIPGFVKNVYCASSGGGKYLAILQVKKRKAHDEGMQRQAALVAFTAFFELKHVILVDDDIDIFDMNDVMWAMTTRYQGDKDTIFIPAMRGHALDPSATPEFNQLLGRPGHHLQDGLRLHGALGARGALRTLAVHRRGPGEVRHQVEPRPRLRRRAASDPFCEQGRSSHLGRPFTFLLTCVSCAVI